jgi:hypothetical protein
MIVKEFTPEEGARSFVIMKLLPVPPHPGNPGEILLNI